MKFSQAMFSRQTFWLCTRSKNPSFLEGATKQGAKLFMIRLFGKMLPFISKLSWTSPQASHILSSLLAGVMFFTNTSLSPTRSAKQTFFSREFWLVRKAHFACISQLLTVRRDVRVWTHKSWSKFKHFSSSLFLSVCTCKSYESLGKLNNYRKQVLEL